jgi:hypothetical protein
VVTSHPDHANSVKLSLIQLLIEENHLFIETKSPPPDPHLSTTLVSTLQN